MGQIRPRLEVFDLTIAGLPALVSKRETAEFLRSSYRHVSRLIEAREIIAVQRRTRSTAPVFVLRESIKTYLERSIR